MIKVLAFEVSAPAVEDGQPLPVDGKVLMSAIVSDVDPVLIEQVDINCKPIDMKAVADALSQFGIYLGCFWATPRLSKRVSVTEPIGVDEK